jgi:DNA polymerase/3'-5' exonuclease PolX
VDQQGRRGLRQLPGIGDHIARALETLVRTGTLPETGEVSVPTKPQDERGDSWGSGVTECSACGTSSR